MALVEYSDSEADSECECKPQSMQPVLSTTKSPVPPPSLAAASQSAKLIQRTSTGKIVVKLPGSSVGRTSEGPPAKRARTEGVDTGSSTSRFSDVSSFLPPPKNKGKPLLSHADSSKAAPKVGVHLKTSSEAAFRRALDEADVPRTARERPSILAGQTPEEEVKLVGRPLMFRPLSVARKSVKRTAAATEKAAAAPAQQPVALAPPPEPPTNKKTSLFWAEDNDEEYGKTEDMAVHGAAAMGDAHDLCDDTASYLSDDTAACLPPDGTSAPAPQSSGPTNELSALADTLNLSHRERRELFGRNGRPTTTSPKSSSSPQLVTFDMQREYEHNEAARASGELEALAHNPVRSAAPGSKHNLRQVVSMVQGNQRGALEASFARTRERKGEAAGKYGWK